MKNLNFMNKKGMQLFSKELEVHRRKIKNLKHHVKAIKLYNAEVRAKKQDLQHLYYGQSTDIVRKTIIVEKKSRFFRIQILSNSKEAILKFESLEDSLQTAEIKMKIEDLERFSQGDYQNLAKFIAVSNGEIVLKFDGQDSKQPEEERKLDLERWLQGSSSVNLPLLRGNKSTLQ